MKKKLFLSVLMILFLFGCSDDRNSSRRDSYSRENSSPSAVEVGFDLVSFFSKHPLIRLLGFLKIISDVSELHNSSYYETSNKNVYFDTSIPNVKGVIKANYSKDNVLFKTPNGNYNFSPNQFVRTHNLRIGDNHSLQQLDSKMVNDYTQCSDEALNSGEGNHIKMLELRISCFERKGYGKNDLTYMRIKHKV